MSAGNKVRRLALAGLVALAACGGETGPSDDPPDAPFRWVLPPGFPTPLVPADNPMNTAKVELGRRLFYDTRLSVTGQFSCGSCHQQARAFSDGLPVSRGATGEAHPRNSMGLANVAYASVLTWANPNMRALERQLTVPIFGRHPVELGLEGKESALVELLRTDTLYQRLLPRAFPAEAEPASVLNLGKAIAAFQRTLISGDSPYDRYVRGGQRDAISESAKRGETLFFSERLECFHCHSGFNFTSSVTYEGKGFTEQEYFNTGLYNLHGTGAFPEPNVGLIEFTQRPEDMGKFKAPTLRNIELTAPYMHDGSVATLDEVVDHYMAGGRTITEGPHAGVGSANPYKSSLVKSFSLTPQERADLLAFLRSLTDSSFITDQRFADPSR